MKIPKISEEALQEAVEKFAQARMQQLSQKEVDAFLVKYSSDFRKEQPVLFEYLHTMMRFHDEKSKGVCSPSQAAIYCMILTHSFRIQSEMDEVRRLLNPDEEE